MVSKIQINISHNSEPALTDLLADPSLIRFLQNLVEHGAFIQLKMNGGSFEFRKTQPDEKHTPSEEIHPLLSEFTKIKNTGSYSETMK